MTPHLPSSSMAASPVVAALNLARTLSGADWAIAIKFQADGVQQTLAIAPTLPFATELPALREDATTGQTSDWQAVEVRHLSSALRLALPLTPAAVRYLDCSDASEHARGGVLLLWCTAETGASAAALDLHGPQHAHPLLHLKTLYGQLLDAIYLRRVQTESSTQFRVILDSVSLGVVVVDGDGIHAHVNRAAASVLEAPSGDMLAMQLADYMHKARACCDNAPALEQAYAPLQHALDSAIVVDWHYPNRTLRVTTHPILGDGQKGRIWLFDDVTAQVMLEDVLRRDATQDVLTDLLNRRALFDQGNALFASCRAAHTAMAVIVLDIDYFKKVNDLYGHPAGDQVLKITAKRVAAAVHEDDIVGRYGGEEFVLVLQPVAPEAVRGIAERIRRVIDEADMQVDGRTIHCTVSLGVALAQPQDTTLEQVIARADQSLYEAKHQGRNRVVMHAST